MKNLFADIIVTRTVLHLLGYRKSRDGSCYKKKRLTRGGGSRCTVKVTLRGPGLFDVCAVEKAIRKSSPTGYDFANNFRTIADLLEWERFAFPEPVAAARGRLFQPAQMVCAA